MKTLQTMTAGNALGTIGGIIRDCIREERIRAGYYDNTREGLCNMSDGYTTRLGYQEGAPRAMAYGPEDY